MLHVVAHELAHARNPVSRPRFLLEVPHGSLDADERSALSVGRRVAETAATGAGIVGNLPVGGSGRIPDVGAAARSALPDVSLPDLHAPDLHAPDLPAPGLPGPDPHLPQLPGVGAAVSSLEQQAGSAVTQAGTAAVQAASGAAGGGVDIDHLAEVLEQRVLRQLERRGGRYSGLF
jgi:hypothetical protein